MSEALKEAAEAGQLETVQAELDSGADPNYRGEHGWTPLLEAVYGDTDAHLAIVRLLLDRGADIEAQPALHGAAYSGNLPLVDLLLERGASLSRLSRKTGEPPLHWASSQMQAESARRLLAAGAEVDQPNVDGWTALMHAAHWDPRGLEVLGVLLAAGANPNAKSTEGWTPLLLASAPEMIGPLLEAGADPNLGHELFGFTPLMALQIRDHRGIAEATRLLVEAGAEVHPVFERVTLGRGIYKPKVTLAANLFSEWRAKIRTRFGKTAFEMSRDKQAKAILREAMAGA